MEEMTSETGLGKMDKILTGRPGRGRNSRKWELQPRAWEAGEYKACLEKRSECTRLEHWEMKSNGDYVCKGAFGPQNMRCLHLIHSQWGAKGCLFGRRDAIKPAFKKINLVAVCRIGALGSRER